MVDFVTNFDHEIALHEEVLLGTHNSYNLNNSNNTDHHDLVSDRTNNHYSHDETVMKHLVNPSLGGNARDNMHNANANETVQCKSNNSNHKSQNNNHDSHTTFARDDKKMKKVGENVTLAPNNGILKINSLLNNNHISKTISNLNNNNNNNNNNNSHIPGRYSADLDRELSQSLSPISFSNQQHTESINCNNNNSNSHGNSHSSSNNSNINNINNNFNKIINNNNSNDNNNSINGNNINNNNNSDNRDNNTKDVNNVNKVNKFEIDKKENDKIDNKSCVVREGKRKKISGNKIGRRHSMSMFNSPNSQLSDHLNEDDHHHTRNGSIKNNSNNVDMDVVDDNNNSIDDANSDDMTPPVDNHNLNHDVSQGIQRNVLRRYSFCSGDGE
eukprot:Awhi_evm1s1690